MASREAMQEIAAKLQEANKLKKKLENWRDVVREFEQQQADYERLVNEALALAAKEDLTITTPDGQEIGPGEDWYDADADDQPPWMSSWC